MNVKNSIVELVNNRNMAGIAGGGRESSMSRTAASRIQAAACRDSGGTTPKHSFASRAMSAAYRNEPYPSDHGNCPCLGSCTLL